jgi:NAD-dependent SIR2 family protein deacetylase
MPEDNRTRNSLEVTSAQTSHADTTGRASAIKLRDSDDLARIVSTPKPGDTPYVFFLGAGASVSSKISTARKMVEEWQRYLYDNLVGDSDTAHFRYWCNPENNRCRGNWDPATTYRNWRWSEYGNTNESDYSLLFRRAFTTKQQRQNYIEILVDGKEPGPGYLFLAGLIKAEKANCVLTTNFDNLIHDALFRYYNIRPVVAAFDSAVSGFRFQTRRPKIIKLHGDFLFDNVRSMKDELLLLDRNMDEKMHDVCKGCGLIVVGYSGADDSIMHPLSAMLRTSEHLQMGLHWCLLDRECECDGADDRDRIPHRVRDMAENFPAKVTLYKIASFDFLMETIFRRCSCAWPEAFKQPERHGPLQLFAASVTSASSERPSSFLSTRLVEFVEAARDSATSLWADLVLADLLHVQARHAWDGNDLKAAKDLAVKARDAIERYDASSVTLPIEPRIRIIRRRSGLAIFNAKVAKKEGLASAPGFLHHAIELIRQGLEMVESEGSHGIDPTYLRSLPFNGCCAFGLLDLWGTELGEQEKERVLAFVRRIQSADQEGEHMDKLCNGSDGRDFQQSLLPKLRGYIEDAVGQLPIRARA